MPDVTPSDEWETRLAAVWADDLPDDELRAAIDGLVDELPAGHPVGLYERGGAFDSTGDPATAVGLYRAALAAGLAPDRRRQCVIQLASSLRNLGSADAAVDLLAAEIDRGPDELDAQLRAFYALALADVGREREAVGIAVGAVGTLVHRYRRSLIAYAADLAPDP